MAWWRTCRECHGRGETDCSWCEGAATAPDGSNCRICIVGKERCLRCEGQGGWFA